ncbi:MAG: DUF2027 domain-containing protein [Prevotella sp.]|nr:DUF2027 domain-containing protein [Bacteroidales bacterium]MDD7660201.1 DUF2027 domain-containing protein [Bacteroidales bacterium]MDY3674321.1 DUF2027 domain-containing protein [Prevotella sp.]MDY4432497.1 DUF2027 domain-containing protein [Prevotella sp.]MDY4968608.1 DUF2027 domain-containing protein [Prevotella sp.]
MKKGDKVRFLFDTGGGTVAAVKGNIVMVEDADGFQIPTPINEVVLDASQESYSTSSMVAAMQRDERRSAAKSDGRSMRALLNEGMEEEADNAARDDDPADKEITFKRPVEERKGGNLLNAYLAFVPVDIKKVTDTEFDTYLVNDSNYYLHYTYLSAENNSWTVRAEGVLEPNTKEYIEEFTLREVNALSRVCIQMTAFKREKPFSLKQPVSVMLRIDQVKFYKLHVFQPNDFFEQPALLYTIIEDDKPARSIDIDANSLKQEMYATADDKERLTQLSTRTPRKGLEEAEVIDLHAEKLLDNTGGMSSADILNYQLDHFRRIMKEHRHEKGKKIIFIHGKGEGVLRHAIIHELVYRYRPCTYQDASFQEYGYGATQVTIK